MLKPAKVTRRALAHSEWSLGKLFATNFGIQPAFSPPDCFLLLGTLQKRLPSHPRPNGDHAHLEMCQLSHGSYLGERAKPGHQVFVQDFPVQPTRQIIQAYCKPTCEVLER